MKIKLAKFIIFCNVTCLRFFLPVVLSSWLRLVKWFQHQLFEFEHVHVGIFVLLACDCECTFLHFFFKYLPSTFWGFNSQEWSTKWSFLFKMNHWQMRIVWDELEERGKIIPGRSKRKHRLPSWLFFFNSSSWFCPSNPDNLPNHFCHSGDLYATPAPPLTMSLMALTPSPDE